MLQSFCQYIADQKLFIPSQHRILLAVSGGMDSVVMCHLFSKAGYSFAIAHCNFKLRGSESDTDEAFVKNMSQKYQVPFFCRHFDTDSYAQEQKISIQMAARDLRYAWFHEILKQEHYDFIATAHHQNDAIETVLLNLTKGTGIQGLHGIKATNGKLIRPLLFTNRRQIDNYAAIEKLSWREDSSNESTKYQRNLIRLEIIPLLKKINPNLEDTLTQTIQKITAVENVFQHKIEEVKKTSLREGKNYTAIDIENIKKEPEPGIILAFLLQPYHFNYTDSHNLLNTTDTGKRIESETHIAVKDRSHFIITKKNNSDFEGYYIEKTDKSFERDDFRLTLTSLENDKNFKIPVAPDVACMDFDKLKFPLLIRNWTKGDYFYPLGMNSAKKISDFLIDNKIPLNLKEKVKVLVSDNRIVWVIGWRLDNRFKISADTKKIFMVKTENA